MNMGQIWVCAGLTLATMSNAACADILRLPVRDGDEGGPTQARLRDGGRLVRSEEPPLPVKAPRPAVQREILSTPGEAQPSEAQDVRPARNAASTKLAAADAKPASSLGEVKPKPRPAAKGPKEAGSDGCTGGDGCTPDADVRDGSLTVLNYRTNPYLPRMLPPGAGIDWPAPQFSGALIVMPTGEKGQVDEHGIARAISEPAPAKRLARPVPADAPMPVRATETVQTIRLSDWQKDDCLDSILDQIDDPASLQLTSDFQIDPRALGQGGQGFAQVGGGGPMRVAVDITSLDSKGTQIDSRLICTFEQRNGEWQFSGSRLRPAYRRPPSVM